MNINKSLKKIDTKLKKFKKLRFSEKKELNFKKGKKGFSSTLKGEYIPKNKNKFIIKKNSQNKGRIIYRSSWELKFLQWCDNNKNITKVLSEGIKIPYKMDNKQRNYFPDFLIEMKRNNKKEIILIEIKPKSLTETKQNKIKFAAAKNFAKQHKIKFLVLTEVELKNLLK